MIKGYTLKNLILRIYSEIFFFPQTKILKSIRYIFKSKFKVISTKQISNFYFLWDLNYEAATFDLSYALLLADQLALKNRIKFNVMIVKRKRKDYKKFYPISINQINKRIDLMLIPLCYSFKNCEKVEVFETLKEIKDINKKVFLSFNSSKRISYFNYKYFFKNLITEKSYDGISANSKSLNQSLNILKKYNLNPKNLITLTLRTYNYEVLRNTDPKFWINVLNYLKNNNFQILIIPDTDDINNIEFRKIFKDYTFVNEFSLHLELKIAIYEISMLNLFPYSGNATLSQINKKSSSLTFIKTNKYYKHSTIKYFNSIGQTVNETYKFLTKKHLVVWNTTPNEFINIVNKQIEYIKSNK
jgi:hypothetical protein